MTSAPSTLREVLLARAATDPDRLAFDDGSRRVTYRELVQRASGQAMRLRSRVGRGRYRDRAGG